MRPFEFIIIFLSFIYTLALTHLLLAVVGMIRHRKNVILSFPHALWMACAFTLLGANWLALWDFHHQQSLSLGVMTGGFALVVVQYINCALVAPDFDDGDPFDLRRFHAEAGKTYIFGFLALLLTSIVANLGAAQFGGVARWGEENFVVLVMSVPVILALLVQRNWVQVMAPLSLLVMVISFTIFYYPVLE